MSMHKNTICCKEASMEIKQDHHVPRNHELKSICQVMTGANRSLLLISHKQLAALDEKEKWGEKKCTRHKILTSDVLNNFSNFRGGDAVCCNYCWGQCGCCIPMEIGILINTYTLSMDCIICRRSRQKSWSCTRIQKIRNIKTPNSKIWHSDSTLYIQLCGSESHKRRKRPCTSIAIH